MAKQIVIKADILYDGKKKRDNQWIIVEQEKIIAVTSKFNGSADYEGIVTPGFIDAHSHIGLDRDGEPFNEGETNDVSSQFMPLNNPLNSIYFDDRAFLDTVDYGVLYSCIVPGSGNLLGGKAKIIRNYAKFTADAEIRDYGYKMALGYNPRSTGDWRGDRPNTRMGIYSLLEKKFDEILYKKEKQLFEHEKKIKELDKKLEKSLKKENSDKKDEIFTKKEYDEEINNLKKESVLHFNTEEKAILEILEGKKTVKIHVHKDDDVFYLLYLVKKYGIKVTAEHTGDVFNLETFNALAKADIPVVYGPLQSLAYKVELKHAFYQNVEILMRSKVFYGLMTDHPVIHSMTLKDQLKFFMRYGLSEEDAVGVITYKNAKILGIDDILGSIESGKWASLIVWKESPFYLGSYPTMVMGEGKILRK